MKIIYYLTLLFSIFSVNSSDMPKIIPVSQNLKLFLAIETNNLIEFENALNSGADVNAIFDFDLKNLSADKIYKYYKIRIDPMQLCFPSILRKNCSIIEAALYNALISQDNKIINILLKRGISISNDQMKQLKQLEQDILDQDLMASIILGDIKRIKKNLALGANANSGITRCFYERPNYPLWLTEQFAQMHKVLIENFIDNNFIGLSRSSLKNLKDKMLKYSSTPYIVIAIINAIEKNDPRIPIILLRAGAEIYTDDIETLERHQKFAIYKIILNMIKRIKNTKIKEMDEALKSYPKDVTNLISQYM